MAGVAPAARRTFFRRYPRSLGTRDRPHPEAALRCGPPQCNAGRQCRAQPTKWLIPRSYPSDATAGRDVLYRDCSELYGTG